MNNAKSIFVEHHGSQYNMSRRGVREQYLSYGVSRDQEIQWAREKIDGLMKEFIEQRLANYTLHVLVEFSKAVDDPIIFSETASVMLGNMSELDTFTKIRFAETLRRVLEWVADTEVVDAQVEMSISQAIIKLAKSAEEEPFEIDRYYRAQKQLIGCLTVGEIHRRLKKLTDFAGELEEAANAG